MFKLSVSHAIIIVSLFASDSLVFAAPTPFRVGDIMGHLPHKGKSTGIWNRRSPIGLSSDVLDMLKRYNGLQGPPSEAAKPPSQSGFTVVSGSSDTAVDIPTITPISIEDPISTTLSASVVVSTVSTVKPFFISVSQSSISDSFSYPTAVPSWSTPSIKTPVLSPSFTPDAVSAKLSSSVLPVIPTSASPFTLLSTPVPASAASIDTVKAVSTPTSVLASAAPSVSSSIFTHAPTFSVPVAANIAEEEEDMTPPLLKAPLAAAVDA